MNFESKLSQGRFSIPECDACKKIIWPPTEHCKYCFGKVSFREETHEGKIIEFSMKDDEFFCVVEFENSIRIIAKMLQRPQIDQFVKISKCGIINGDYFFQVS